MALDATLIVAFDNEAASEIPPHPELRASRFGVIVAHPHQYPDPASLLEANPDLKLLLYTKGTRTRDDDLPEEWYAHNAEGDRVMGTDDNAAPYLMNPASGWAGHVAAQAVRRLEDSGFNGIHLDGLGSGRMTATDSRSIDPRTEQEYDPADWQADVIALSGKVKEACDCYMIVNGIGDHVRYAAGSWKLARWADAGVAEGWLRTPMQSGPTPSDAWEASMAMLRERPRRMIVYPKNWTDADSETKRKEMRWAYATFLLVQEPGRSGFAWSDHRGLTRFDPLWDLPLGRPLGQYTAKGKGVYVRDYAAGSVRVDATGTAEIEVASRSKRATTKRQ